LSIYESDNSCERNAAKRMLGLYNISQMCFRITVTTMQYRISINNKHYNCLLCYNYLLHYRGLTIYCVVVVCKSTMIRMGNIQNTAIKNLVSEHYDCNNYLLLT